MRTGQASLLNWVLKGGLAEKARRSKDFIFILNYFGSTGKTGTKLTLKMEAVQVPYPLLPQCHHSCEL